MGGHQQEVAETEDLSERMKAGRAAFVIVAGFFWQRTKAELACGKVQSDQVIFENIRSYQSFFPSHAIFVRDMDDAVMKLKISNSNFVHPCVITGDRSGVADALHRKIRKMGGADFFRQL